ncbi:hypothetical protein ACJX0J_034500, partial [Zea mays]
AAGRYRCLELDHPCEAPWCDGPLGVLENNGWVYSAHCSFKLFATDASWRCLDGKWLFFWGDSNHVDTIRNLLTFVLGITDTSAVTRRFDAVFTNPSGGAGTLRITSIFNGHWNMSMNYLGLHSLRNRGFRQLIRSYFMSGDRVPDVVVLNSGLHDGCYWTSVRIYAQAADFAAQFWSGVMDKVRARGHAVPRVFYQTQMPQGGIDAGKNQATPFTELRDEAGVTYSHPQGWVTLQTLPNEVLVVLQKQRQQRTGRCCGSAQPLITDWITQSWLISSLKILLVDSTRKFNLYSTR